MSLRRGAAVGRTLAVGLVLAAAVAVPVRAQQPIPIGTSVTGQLTQFDPVMTDQTHYKVFTFQGTAGQTVQIDLMSADFDAYLYLKDQNGNSIAHDDDSGGGRNARIIQVLPYTGLYQIYANTVGRGETGAFTLQLRSGGEASQMAQSSGMTQQIPIGTSVQGQLTQSDPTLSDGSHYKMFTFMGTSGQTVQIDLMSSAFDSYLYLRNSSGQSIAHDDDSGGGLNACIVQTLPYSGQYQILANTLASGQFGAFTLQLQAVQAGHCGGQAGQPQVTQPQVSGIPSVTSLPLTGQIAVNQQVQNTLYSGGVAWNSKPIQLYGYQCTAGQLAQIDVLGSWDNYLIVFDPNGVEVAHDDDSGGSLQARLQFSCPASGLYRLGVTTALASTSPGPYTLRVQQMQATTGAAQPLEGQPTGIASVTSLPLTGQIAMNQQVQNTLYSGGTSWNSKPIQLYGYQCTAGQLAQIDVLGSWDNYLVVFDPNGVEVAHDDDSGGSLQARLQFSCPASGLYRLGVTT
ncbi:MAG TPA: PPC domain-containing protein, partial [Gemmatimonadales bacterium]|nr:PPC domain-containing protein [Gemmatimonadales bacterium]